VAAALDGLEAAVFAHGDAGNSYGCKRRSHHSSAMDHGILLIAADQSRRPWGRQWFR